MGRTARWAMGCATLWVFSGCEPVPPASMADLTFPPGFRLDTGREVTLTVRAAGDLDGVRVAVSTPDGRPLFDGRATAAAQGPITLRLPPGVDAVSVETTRRGASIATQTAVVGDDLTASVDLVVTP